MNDSATNSFLCESRASNTLAVSVPAVGISKNLTGRIRIFPNPSADNVNVNSDKTINSIKVLNYTGQPIYCNNNVNTKSAQFKVSTLQAGIYFVKVTYGKGTEILKIMVIH